MEVSLGALSVPSKRVGLCFADELSDLGAVLVKEHLQGPHSRSECPE